MPDVYKRQDDHLFELILHFGGEVRKFFNVGDIVLFAEHVVVFQRFDEFIVGFFTGYDGGTLHFLIFAALVRGVVARIDLIVDVARSVLGIGIRFFRIGARRDGSVRFRRGRTVVFVFDDRLFVRIERVVHALAQTVQRIIVIVRCV